MYYIWLVLAVFCLGYYLVCASYAGVGSSFIFIWLIGTALFAEIFIVRLAEVKNVITVNRVMKYIFTILFSAGVLIFLIIEGLIVVNMRMQPKDNCKYIIVLGCQIRGDRITKSLRYRLDAAYEYAADNPDTVIIVSGGQGRGENKTEALAMKEYLVDKGISDSRIIMEDKSTDTSENMRYSAVFIEDKEADIAVVTNNFHIFRSKMLARAQGFKNVSGISSRSDNYLFLNYMVRESIGVVKDFFAGNF